MTPETRPPESSRLPTSSVSSFPAADDGTLQKSFGVTGRCAGMNASQHGGDVVLTLDDSVVYWPMGSPQPSAEARHPSAENVLE